MNVNKVAPNFGAGCCKFEGATAKAAAPQVQPHFGISLSDTMKDVAAKIAPKQEGSRLNFFA